MQIIKVILFVFCVGGLQAQTMLLSVSGGCAGDLICEQLTTSQSDYISAAPYDWVFVTNTEYDSIEAQGWASAANSSISVFNKWETVNNIGVSNNYTFGTGYWVAVQLRLQFNASSSDISIWYGTAANSSSFTQEGQTFSIDSTTAGIFSFVQKTPNINHSTDQYLGVYYEDGNVNYYGMNGSFPYRGVPPTITSGPSSAYVNQYVKGILASTKQW